MTKVRVAINGFGRIGRNIVRAIYESGRKDIDVVAVNDLGPVETNAHLLQFDSVHGRFPHEVTVKGDSISLSISAASIIAKVTRDDIMLEIDREFPQFGFAKHQGYGTKAHLEALRIHGPCRHHRRSFQPVAQLALPLDGL